MAAVATVQVSPTESAGFLCPSTGNEQISSPLPKAIAFMNPRQTPPPRALSTSSASVLDDASSAGLAEKGPDSGYVSAASCTPENIQGSEEGGFPYQHPKTTEDLGNGLFASRKLFQRTPRKLQFYDKKIPPSYWNRFNDLNEQYGKALLDYLSKGRTIFGPISTKMKVLGESEATAKPWIIVLCDKTVSKKVRQFYEQKHVKLDYQPVGADTDLPSLEVVVCDRPPRPMAADIPHNVYGSWAGNENLETLCGQIIKVYGYPDARFATIGGIIKIVTPEQDVLLYGMTAGHVFPKNLSDNIEADVDYSCHNEVDSGEDVDNNQEPFSDELGDNFYEEIFELDLALELDQTPETIDRINDVAKGVAHYGESSTHSNIGHVVMTSDDKSIDPGNLDWALFKIDEPSLYRPNLVITTNPSNERSIRRELREFSEDPSSEMSRSVILLSGIGGLKQGSLSTHPSLFMLGSGRKFIKTYTLTLTESSNLNAGDCGSWVIDSINYKVYGHVVASDDLGDAYIVPIRTTFEQMKERFSAKLVGLPTELDILSWRDHEAGNKAVIRENTQKDHEIAVEDTINVATPVVTPRSPEPKAVKLPYDDEVGQYSLSISPKGYIESQESGRTPALDFEGKVMEFQSVQPQSSKDSHLAPSSLWRRLLRRVGDRIKEMISPQNSESNKIPPEDFIPRSTDSYLLSVDPLNTPASQMSVASLPQIRLASLSQMSEESLSQMPRRTVKAPDSGYVTANSSPAPAFGDGDWFE